MLSTQFYKIFISVFCFIAIYFVSCSDKHTYVIENQSQLLIQNKTNSDADTSKGGYVSFRIISATKLIGEICISSLEKPDVVDCYNFKDAYNISDFESIFLIHLSREGKFRFDEWVMVNKGLFITDTRIASFPRNYFSVKSDSINFIGTLSIWRSKEMYNFEYFYPIQYPVPKEVYKFKNKYHFEILVEQLDLDNLKISGFFEYKSSVGKIIKFWD